MENTLETPLKQSTKEAFSHLPPRAFTQEDRDAAAARRLALQKWAESNLKLDWPDVFGGGRDGVWHKEVFGFPIGEWDKVNPKHPAWAAQCLIVEQHLLDKGVL